MRRNEDHPGWLYLLKEKNRHGRPVWFVRKEKGPRIRIKGVPCTPEFRKNYQTALSAYDGGIQDNLPVPTPRQPAAPKQSLRWLWERYIESPAWLADIGEATRRQRLNIMKHVLAKAGDDPYDA